MVYYNCINSISKGEKMKKILIILLLSMFWISCEKEEKQKDLTKVISTKDQYYKEADGKGGADLKKALNQIITANHKKLTYKEAYNALEYTDEDPNNHENIILFYTGRSQPKKIRSQFDSKDGWNREHVWPKSKGFKAKSNNYAYTDLHHLRPTDTSVNSSKGNKDLDNGGINNKEAIETKSDRDSWEPRDDIKGDTARMMFYMAVRYEGTGGKYDNYDLELVDYTGTESSKENFDGRYGKLSTLLEWHVQDPVDDAERSRHEKVYEIQGNRNPFIDYPEWVSYIWGN
jgi:serine protease